MNDVRLEPREKIWEQISLQDTAKASALKKPRLDAAQKQKQKQKMVMPSPLMIGSAGPSTQQPLKGPLAELQLPPGFRFHPTDEELVVYYLAPKAENIKPTTPTIIADIDLYKYDPWDLPGVSEKATFGEREWYFFSPRDRKYPNGARPNRAAASGYWKATGTDKPISSHGGPIKIGVKKALVFYKGRAPKGVKTNWIMHEYRLADSGISPNHHVHRKGSLRLDDWVLCRIYKKTTNAQRNGKERDSSSCVEEVLASLPEIDNGPKPILLPRLEHTFSGLMEQDLQNIDSPVLMGSFMASGSGSGSGSGSDYGASPSNASPTVDSSSDMLQSSVLIGPGKTRSPKRERGATMNQSVDPSTGMAMGVHNISDQIRPWKLNTTAAQEHFLQRAGPDLIVGTVGDRYRQHAPDLRDLEDEVQSTFRSPINHASLYGSPIVHRQPPPQAHNGQLQQQQIIHHHLIDPSTMPYGSLSYDQQLQRTSSNSHHGGQQQHQHGMFPLQSDDHGLSSLVGQSSSSTSTLSFYQGMSQMQQKYASQVGNFFDLPMSGDLHLTSAGQRGR